MWTIKLVHWLPKFSIKSIVASCNRLLYMAKRHSWEKQANHLRLFSNRLSDGMITDIGQVIEEWSVIQKTRWHGLPSWRRLVDRPMCLVSDEHYDTINRRRSSSSKRRRCRDAGKDEIYDRCRVDDVGLVVFQYLHVSQALLTAHQMYIAYLIYCRFFYFLHFSQS